MTNMGIQRKRSRSIENEFGEEFFPLSKRINNLELTFSQIIINNNNNSQHKELHLHQLSHLHPNEHLQSMHHHHHHQQQQQSQHIGYNPELSLDQNPHYYSKNNVLYDLYLERLRRSESNKSDP